MTPLRMAINMLDGTVEQSTQITLTGSKVAHVWRTNKQSVIVLLQEDRRFVAVRTASISFNEVIERLMKKTPN